MTRSSQIISERINEMISKGQGASLLQKLEFDISIASINELSNYITILLTLIENPNYSAQASDLLIKKVLLNVEGFGFLGGQSALIYNELFQNRVWPFVGLSEIIRRLIGSIVYNEASDAAIILKIPSKETLIEFNVKLLTDFFETQPYNIEMGTRLLYNCWFDIELPDRNIKLSRKAIAIYKNVLKNDFYAFDDYLHYFLRFYWYGGSREWNEGKLIVPEPFYKQIFDSIDGFNGFLEQQWGNTLRRITEDINRLYLDIQKAVYYFEKNGRLLYDDPNVSLKLELHYNLHKELTKK